MDRFQRENDHLRRSNAQLRDRLSRTIAESTGLRAKMDDMVRQLTTLGQTIEDILGHPTLDNGLHTMLTQYCDNVTQLLSSTLDRTSQ